MSTLLNSVRIGVLTLLTGALVTGCSDSVLETPLDEAPEIAVPTQEQLTLDLPENLLVSGAGLSKSGTPPCEQEEWPGPGWACVTRWLLGEVAIHTSERIRDMVVDVMTSLEEVGLPEDTTVDWTDPETGFHFTVEWDDLETGQDFFIAIYDEQGGDQIGEWAWLMAEDGAIDGSFQMLAALMEDGQGPVPQAMLYDFQSNADGSEKHASMEIMISEAPPVEDPGAPTRMLMNADKADGAWTVRYAMYHPTWGWDDESQQGHETYILANAIAGLESSDPAGMRLVALPGDATTVPADVDETHSMCDYESLIWGPFGEECSDNNPFYIFPDGSVQEGGTPPAGFEVLDGTLGSLDYLVTDVTTVRDTEIGFDD